MLKNQLHATTVCAFTSFQNQKNCIIKQSRMRDLLLYFTLHHNNLHILKYTQTHTHTLANKFVKKKNI